ncbi:gluconate permease [Kocuria flava]|uniref:Gluconate permease n=1 Tax=Kocuria flava TaxID=446860 RepID=A0A0U2XL75_9MICC|nr:MULTISPECIES: SLC13 family permease [Kocuria]ALU39106.1 gluconate permease [Kocuria flava]MCD1144633.1 GntP family permease [Kocuria sp. LUK]GEO90777.1 gluconate permease [Kocuria flava]
MDLQLLLALVLGIATIIVLVLRTRLDAFVALLIAALVTGLVAGQPVLEIVSAITTGFGNTLASIGIVIGLGVGIGKILEVSGAANALALAFLRVFGKGREPWALGSVGALVSIPVFCDSGYVIMNPLARSIARVKRAGYVTLALALGCGMTLTHHLVPPTPGPLAVAGILGADLGLLIVVGLVFTVVLLPVVVLYARWIGPKLEPSVEESVREAVYGTARTAGGTTTAVADRPGTAGPGRGADGELEDGLDAEARGPVADPAVDLGEPPAGAKPHRVGAFTASLPLLVPLVLIIANTVTGAIDQNAQGVIGGDEYEPSAWAVPFAFIGNPVIALVIGMVLALYVLLPRWTPRNKAHGWFAEAAASAGLILLITGAGGALGQVLRSSGVGDALAEAIAATPLPAFLVPFLIATLVRIAQGSGTVAMITAASVTAPLVTSLDIAPVVAAMACTAGSMVFSYFNDSYFWVVTRFTGLQGVDALRGWSGITTAVWAGSIPLLFVLNVVLG